MKKEFNRVRSIKDITIFVSIIISGCVLIALPTGAGINITGFFMIFAGIILSLTLKTGHKDAETGEIYQKKEFYFQQTQNEAISKCLKSNPDSIDLSQEDKGNALKLDMYFSKSTGKAYLQLFEYVPYKYEACSELYEHETGNVAKLIG